MKFSRQELGLADTRADLLRLRIPSRALPWLMRKTGRGVDDLVGGCHVYHHTQPNLLEVREAREVSTIFDCIYTLDAGYMDPAAAERMTAVARKQVRRAKRILVPCQYVGAEVVMALGAHPGRISVTQLGCEHVLRHLPPGGFPAAKQPYLLTVSRVDPRKNHPRILQAFERLVQEGFPHRWVIAGPRGWGVEGFERRLDASPVRERVDWRGDVGEAELARLYAQADALLFPSLNEGFGLPPLESMACGTPVVTSCVTATGEVCEGAAMLVEPTDVEEIFLATKRLLSEPELYAELVERGRARAAEYSWERCARQTWLAYQATAHKGEDERPRLYSSL
jgi:alpha-1,3-rhamnosyl/mannosyltransferase